MTVSCAHSLRGLRLLMRAVCNPRSLPRRSRQFPTPYGVKFLTPSAACCKERHDIDRVRFGALWPPQTVKSIIGKAYAFCQSRVTRATDQNTSAEAGFER